MSSDRETFIAHNLEMEGGSRLKPVIIIGIAFLLLASALVIPTALLIRLDGRMDRQSGNLKAVEQEVSRGNAQLGELAADVADESGNMSSKVDNVGAAVGDLSAEVKSIADSVEEENEKLQDEIRELRASYDTLRSSHLRVASYLDELFSVRFHSGTDTNFEYALVDMGEVASGVVREYLYGNDTAVHLTWDEAQTICGVLGGSLAVPFDHAAQSTMASQCKEKLMHSQEDLEDTWIGFIRRDGVNWKTSWGDAVPDVSIYNWAAGQPSNKTYSDCAVMQCKDGTLSTGPCRGDRKTNPPMTDGKFTCQRKQTNLL